MSDDEDKTHDATPHRIEEARKQGRFARSRDAAGLAACAAAVAALVGSREHLGRSMDLLFARSLGDLGAISRGQGQEAIGSALGVLAALAFPPAIAAATFAVAAGAAQAGLRFDTDMLGFKAERLNPLPRLGQVFGGKTAAFETFFALLRVGVVGFMAYSASKSEIPALLSLQASPVSVGFTRIFEVALRIGLKLLGALAVLAVADYAHNRFTLEKSMKMSMKELKEEMRSQEGDPKQKGKLRAKARAMAKKRMMTGVKQADVIVTNPTHVSVALRYGKKDPAPIVVAKGHDDVALAIRTEARKYGIPIVESRALARAIDGEVKIGSPISGAHYNAVAQVLAFVYRLKQRTTIR